MDRPIDLERFNAEIEVFTCTPLPSESCSAILWKISAIFLRTILVLPILYDGIHALMHWIAGKGALPSSINWDAVRISAIVLSILLGWLVAPILIYCLFEDYSHWIANLFCTLIATALVIPLLYAWTKLVINICTTPTLPMESAGLMQKRNEIFQRVHSKDLGSIRRLNLITPDGYKLDALLFTPHGARTDKLLIKATGNGMYYEHQFLKDYRVQSRGAAGYADVGYVDDAVELNVPMLCFNPRGAGLSGGFPSVNALELDAYTAYKYGIGHIGLDPSSILYFGFSMGGAYGALGAARIQQEHPESEIHFVNALSFGQFPKTARLALGDGTLGSMAEGILNWTGWDMDAATALHKLRGKKLVIHRPANHDNVIMHEASMKASLEKLSTENVDFFKLDGSGHSLSQSPEQRTALLNKMREYLLLNN